MEAIYYTTIIILLILGTIIFFYINYAIVKLIKNSKHETKIIYFIGFVFITCIFIFMVLTLINYLLQ